MLEIKIDNNNSNQRLDKFLLKYLNKANKSFIYKMLRKKNIKLNSSKASGNEILKFNDNVTLFLSDETINKFREYKVDYSFYNKLNPKTIIYEDKNIIIINKPVGVIVHSATNNSNENTLINSIIRYLIEKGDYIPAESNGFKPAICNRLDVNTSGIVVAGKNLGSVQHLNKMFKDKTINKIYETIVIGKINNEGLIKGFHKKDDDNNIVKILPDNANGELKKVHTEYAVIKSNNNFSHLRIKLITGKTHQIRASLQYINHSIIGDKKYGDNDINSNFKKKYKLNHQLLHASKLIFKENDGLLGYMYNKEFTAKKTDMFDKIEKDIFL